MQICVYGLWHLGCVTAACAAAAGHHVVGLELDEAVVNPLRAGTVPIAEPGLAELVAQQMAAGRLAFTNDPATALRDADVMWVCFDTPVDEQDRADVGFVRDRIERVGPALRRGAIALISSQVPVGFSRALQRAEWAKDIHLASSPENLRLGRAIEVFTHAERVIIGTGDPSIRPRLAELFAPLTSRIEWMSLESAEMTKHAINAFLATSVTFANELARLCEVVGADAKDVERGLKSEGRIGPKAYLAPGVAFAGGTLARDLQFLTRFGREHDVDTPLLAGVITGNRRHQQWTRDKVRQLIGATSPDAPPAAQPVVAVLGLTYKPGTDTLRRSAAVELARWMHQQGMRVRAHDPAISVLPDELRSTMELCADPRQALAVADLAVLATEWPQYRALRAADFTSVMRRPSVIDPNWFLADALRGARGIRYVTTGRDSATAEREPPAP